MLLMPNKKKIATMIVASLKKPDSFVQKLGEENGTGEYKLPEGDDDEGSMGLEAAMEDFLKAADRKDARGMAKAFKNAFVLCEGHDGEEYESEVE